MDPDLWPHLSRLWSDRPSWDRPADLLGVGVDGWHWGSRHAASERGCPSQMWPGSGQQASAPVSSAPRPPSACPHSPHSSPSCAISMRAKAKDSSSLHLNHLSTTCGQDQTAGSRRRSGRCAVGVGGPTAVFTTSQIPSVQEAVTLKGHSPAPAPGSETQVYKAGTSFLSLVQHIVHVAIKLTAGSQGTAVCPVAGLCPSELSPLEGPQESVLGSLPLTRFPCSTIRAPGSAGAWYMHTARAKLLGVFAQ